MHARFLALIGLCLCACRGTSHEDDSHAAPSLGTSGQPGEASASSRLGSDDQAFVEKAANGGRFEVDSSNLALLKGVSGSTRDFANMMLDDHGKANAELERLAQGKGLALPVKLDAQHQQKLDQLSALDGEAFESAYREMQLKAHEEAIALFKEAAEGCEDADLRGFAKKTLPTLLKHREHISGPS
jgi:putative membrane protein